MRLLISGVLGLIFCVGAFCAVPAGQLRQPVPKGFVTTRGAEFELDGKPFAFVGANSYWLPLLTSTEDVELTFQEMQQAGVKVLRTWGFNAINASELAGALQSNLTYYQVWENGDWTLNDGPQGLQRLDRVLNVAAKHGIKIILTFTNNWVGYGGSELYINHITPGASAHDVFYTNSKIIASYQRYVKTLVQRYKNSPAIFAWEMMNEARCLGDLPASAACAPGTGTLGTWYKEQSDFIRSLDPHHLITTGGEGHFFWKHPVKFWFNHTLVSDYNFDGRAGEDLNRDLLLPNVDFATYHIYPQLWYPQLDFPGSNFTIESWGLFWIDEHVKAAKKATKPLVLEEFGVTGITNQSQIYSTWVERALDTKHGGIMPWQFGALGLKEGNRVIKYADVLLDGASPNDGLAIYKNETKVWDIFRNAAKVQAVRSL
ncbi:glycoside hydrolase [Mycena rebaudengoi]|nr:glycoside hydrolase [Mycena rebaudengoi]